MSKRHLLTTDREWIDYLEARLRHYEAALRSSEELIDRLQAGRAEEER